MANLTLDQLNSAIEDKFGDFTIEILDADGEPEELAFMYYLRAPKSARAKLAEAFTKLGDTGATLEEGEDGVEALIGVFKDAFKALAVKPQHFNKLKALLGDDLVKWTYVLNEYGQKYSQQGEA